MRYASLAAAAITCLALSHDARSQETIDAGWWIVAGSFSNPDNSVFNTPSVRSASRQVSRCGVVPFADFSMKFRGFAPGYDVVVVGPYTDRGLAERYLDRVRPCVPEAYLKQGEYLGE